jgi:hypothetical protein
MAEAVSNLVANKPESPEEEASRLEEAAKAELLKGLSLEDVRNLVSMVRNNTLPASQQSHADTFDEFGRNFRRMVHRMEVVGSSSTPYFDERPMAMSLEEARKTKPPSDYFDPNEQVWILRGVKRQKDYPENTVDYNGGPPR